MRLWNIPVMYPNFADSRGIASSAESKAQGLDPMVNNPNDPWGRPLNYPRIWQYLYFFGINKSHTPFIAFSFLLFFLIGVCLILPNPNNIMISIVLAALFSPVTLFSFERGNVDLFIFFIVAISILCIRKYHFLSCFFLLFAFLLKLFPIFGIVIFLKLNRKNFIRYLIFVFIFGILYVFFTFSDLETIKNTTPQSTYYSYGFNVFWMTISYFHSNLESITKLISYLALGISFLYALTSLFNNEFKQDAIQNKLIYLDAFRMGSSIYIGTFLLGNNYDYRLIFLILTIPMLILWIKSDLKISILGIIILVSVLLLMWNPIIEKISSEIPNSYFICFSLKELSSWVVFSGFLYLTFWSMPDWIKMYSKDMRIILQSFIQKLKK